MSDELADALAAVARAHDQLAREVASLAAQRDHLIVACYRTGLSLRDLGRLSGLHYTRVRQILTESNLDPDVPFPQV